MVKQKQKQPVQTDFRVKKGGPEVLAEINSNRTLFLCYPDENDDAAIVYDDIETERAIANINASTFFIFRSSFEFLYARTNSRKL